MTNKYNKITLFPKMDIDEENIAKASERFLKVASSLNEEEFIETDIKLGLTESKCKMTFYSNAANMTSEDVKWIFQGCASIEAEEHISYKTSDENEPNTYAAYTLLPPHCDSNRSYYFHLSRSEYIEPMIDMLAEKEATICIRAGIDYRDILIVLPEEMELRMKALIPLTFSEIVAERMWTDESTETEVECLSEELFLRGMKSMFTLYIYKLQKTAGIIEGMNADEDEIELDEDYEDEAFNTEGTPIKALELSVRSYNCLRRAGINTVEQLQKKSDDELMKIRNLGKKHYDEIKEKMAAMPKLTAAVPLKSESYMKMLDELIGLEDVKKQIRKIAAFARMKKKMVAQGKPDMHVALNMEFVGNPGTAKTTVARIIAGIFYEIGLLSTNEIVEVGRADIVAKYEGQTASKVKNVFSKAKGKVLFIDEAYSLEECWEGAYGDEAINTIVQEMENNRADTIVVFAGYPGKMESFFKRNPGLRSRVPFSISFADYSAEELLQIVKLEATRKGFSIDPHAEKKVLAICETAAGDKTAGNGRFCRNLVDNAILEYALRICQEEEETALKAGTELKLVLIENDFNETQIARPKHESRLIGFRG